MNCSKGFYFNRQRKCESIDPLCKGFDENIGGCTSCYPGFALVNNQCIIDQERLKTSKCAVWEDGVCTKCTDRAYFGADGKCKEVNKLCKGFNQQNGRCTSCYPGYNLNALQGTCEVASTIEGCAEIDENGMCKKCSKGYF